MCIRDRYGAFAAPITVLLILYLLTIVTYGAASLTAGLAEKTDAAVTAPGADQPTHPD